MLQLFYKVSVELEAFLFKAVTPEVVETFTNNAVGVASQDALFGLFAEYVVSNYSKDLQSYR